MAHLAHIPVTTGWLALALGLYLLVGMCWLPVVWLQIQMHGLADRAIALKQDLPPIYFRYAGLWFALGWPAFISVIGIFYLMVLKPGF